MSFTPAGGVPAETRCDGWKEIAAYFNISPKQARRWEKLESMPVHRHDHTSRSSVYALASELDHWREMRGMRTDQRHSGVAGIRSSFGLELPIVELTAANRFYFGTRRVPFSGRDWELARLTDFLNDFRPLLWWLVEGPAGSGKSRLALEVCQLYRESWDVGFLPDWQDLGSVSARHFRSPTLLVCDYAGSRAREIQEFILRSTQECSCNGGSCRIRVLLLERDHNGPWWQQFRGVGRTQHTLRAIQFDEALPLQNLKPDDLWDQVVSACEQDRRAVPPKDVFLNLLERLDPLGRPLLAQMATEVFLADPAKSTERAEILREVLRREDIRFWQPAHVTARDKQLLAFATMVKGIPVEEALSHPLLKDLVPGPDEFNPDRYQALCGQSSSDVLRPLEPDLLGELFVLDQLTPRHPADRQRILKLWDAAWDIEGPEFVEFMLRAAADFRDHVAWTHLLSVDSRAHLIQLSVLYRDLIKARDPDRLVSTYHEMEAIAFLYPATSDGMLEQLADALESLTWTLVDAHTICGGDCKYLHAALVLFDRFDERVQGVTTMQVQQDLARTIYLLAVMSCELRDRTILLRMVSEIRRRHQAFTTDPIFQEAAAGTVHALLEFFAVGRTAGAVVPLPSPGDSRAADIESSDVTIATHFFEWLGAVAEGAALENAAIRYLFAGSTGNIVILWGHEEVALSVRAVERLRSIVNEYPADVDLAAGFAYALRNLIYFVGSTAERWQLMNDIRSVQARWPNNTHFIQERILALQCIGKQTTPSEGSDRARVEAELLVISGDCELYDERRVELRSAIRSLLSTYARFDSSRDVMNVYRRLLSLPGTSGSLKRFLEVAAEGMLAAVATRDQDLDTVGSCYRHMKEIVDSCPDDSDLQRDRICCGANLLMLYARDPNRDAAKTTHLTTELLDVAWTPGVDLVTRAGLTRALEGCEFWGDDADAVHYMNTLARLRRETDGQPARTVEG